MGTGRAALMPARFDPALPVNQAKLDAVEELTAVAEDLGRTLPELALAFPLAHPAVTSVIIGPRTLGQLEAALKGSDLVLDDAALDRIDAIVPPGTNVYHPDGVWQPRALTEPALRRRPEADRRAAG